MERKLTEAEFHDTLEYDRETLDKQAFLSKYSNMKFYSITARSRNHVDRWLRKNCPGARALDYCCGEGQVSLQLASHGATVVGIDISPKRVAAAGQLLADSGYTEQSTFQVMDAEQLDFSDDSFDVIVCSGVLHHLDTSKAFPELARVLKSTGKIICIEALAYNPLIHWYRKRTPHLRTEWEKDHILTHRDLKTARKTFRGLSTRYFHLAAIAAVPFLGKPIFRHILALGNFLDDILLRIPVMRLLAWQMVFVLSSPRSPGEK